jgi:acetolactate synthase-1/2/3 large subunit
MLCGAEVIVETLKQAGVEVVFGIPSIHNIRLYEAMRHEPAIKHILCRNESMATHMADGYARASNRLGVVIASTGPGTCYVLPALQEASGSCSPVLVITTNIPTTKIGKGLGVLHELENQELLFAELTKVTASVRSENEIRPLMEKAIQNALSARRGPVYLEIPFDLLDKKIVKEAEILQESRHEDAIGSDIDKALSILLTSKQPLMIIGREVVRADITDEVNKLAEKLGAPVITTTNGKGVIPEDHIQSFGNAARRGVVREMVQHCDMALAIGTRLRSVDAKRRGLRLPKLIHIDWDDRWINRNFPAEVEVCGDLKEIVKSLLERLDPVPSVEERMSWIGGMHQRLKEELAGIRKTNREMEYLDAIRETLSRDGILVIDNTMLGYWAEYFYPCYFPGGFVGAKGSSTIGFAFAGAIGTKLACPDKPLVALIGDGGFLYSEQELATCIRHKIGFPVIVVNDNAYGVIAYLQRAYYQNEYESRMINPDFVTLAQSYGAHSLRVDSPKGLKEVLEQALASDELWVIELHDTFPEPAFGRY